MSRLWLIEFERGKPRAEIGLVLRTLTALGLHLDVSTPVTSEPTPHVAAPPDIDAVVNAARKRKKQ